MMARIASDVNQGNFPACRVRLTSPSKIIPLFKTPEKPVKFKNAHSSCRAVALCLGFPTLISATLHASSEMWNGGAATNVLNTPGNWTNNSLPSAATDTATWDGTAAGALTLIWNANFGPTSGNTGGVNINLSATQTDAVQLDATAGNFGLGDVTIASGAGALTLGDAVGTATMVMRDPTMLFSNNSANTATVQSDVVFANGGGGGNRSVTIDGSGNWTLNAALFPAAFTSVASAVLVKNGAGTLTLASQNFHGGTNTLNGGIIHASANSALGTGGTVKIPNAGGRVRLSGGISLPNSFELPGRTSVTNSTPEFSNIENVSGNNHITGNLSWNTTGGTYNNILSSADTLTLSGNLSTTLTTGPRTFYFTGAGNIIASGNITDGVSTPLGVAKGGNGTLTLSGTNSYTLGTSVLGGTLALDSADAIGSSGPILFGGGTLQYSASNTTDYSARIAAGLSTGAVSIDTNGQNVTFATALTADQSGGLTKRGAGTLGLTTANAFGGNTTLSGGILAVQSSSALSAGTVVLPNPSGRLQLSGDISLPNEIQLSGATNDASISFNFSKIQNVSGNNTISGNIVWNTGGGTFTNLYCSTGLLTLGGNLTTTLATGPRTFNFAGEGDFLINGSIIDGASQPIAISKVGVGTTTLSGPNTYTGATTISAGKLVLASTGSIDSSQSLDISAGATLDTTAKTSFTLPPVVTIGLNGTSATSGFIDAYGSTLDIDGAAVTFSVTGILTAQEYVIAEYASISGTPAFASITPPDGYMVKYDHNGGTQIALVQNTATPYDSWISSFFGNESNPAIIGRDADPDGDGVNNLLEFSLNGDPDSGSNNGLVASFIQDASLPAGNELTLIIAVRDGATFNSTGSPTVQTATQDGVIYTIEGSLDLVTLPGSAVSHVSGPADTAPPAVGLPDLTGTDWSYHTFKLDASDGLTGKGFLRARIESAP